ncbi:uncharacterized protein CcaverHIS019_0401420 [Cutaneotrichosporon cavernicola]|uniref:Uncharacterized protein n=1 Tax=Cutaneotrichosporon cavernicola TaxID=279322 RepID=A0AA48QVL4_9TREE|nr:uncharacterized protein CcaverHIS019_0401420 [Cutaneotrichosporon cavernicola]BEI91322.1 hypothetical protein CcaverHIS019_0401420 [Cutaneotrichosporon cavernicola]BEI99095.1 hypothetical protein CcaverHIS631_0401380 [Cutaneotrichosporon cavernicola]BEJ06869.1 hypothetical protein CcaverHIS641_0401380 [Cutaneotrichosporon cavernicola]
MPEKRPAFSRVLGLFDWEYGAASSPSAFGSLSPPPTPTTISPSSSTNSNSRRPLPPALRSPRSATFPPPTLTYSPSSINSAQPSSISPPITPSPSLITTSPPPTHSSLPPIPTPPSTSPRSYPSSLSIPPASPGVKETRFPAVPTPPSMSPRSYPSSMSRAEAPPLTPPDRQVTFSQTPTPSRPGSLNSTTSSAKKASIGRVHNLFSNTPRNRVPAAVAVARPAPPLPSYESIQVVAHRPEDIAAVRSSLAQLQLTWSLYRELGRPSNLAEALERQLGAVVGNVDRLADLPPFTITVPIQRRD